MIRAEWKAVADDLLVAAWRWATPRGALLNLPGRPSHNGERCDGLEGYARTFLAAAFRVADGTDPLGWIDRYAAGLEAGTATPGRDDAESWPVIGDIGAQGQPMVESASVALGLRVSRPWLWDQLDSHVQDRVEGWLRGALRHVPAPNNWYLFPFTVAGFLESVGRGDAETARARERALELLETWYLGEGWYSDGDGRAFDHYNGWALHLYPVLDSYLAGTDSPHRERLREHLESFTAMFGTDGAPIHFGRSLTYRFAAASAVALGAVTGDTPLSYGRSRALISSTLRYFLDRGAIGPNGLLSLGWHGPQEATLQSYSGPASPYWASKAFVCLLAPADHPLWTEEGSLPDEDRVLALRGPGLLVQRVDGTVRLHNHGSDHVGPDEAESAADDDPHYGRFAYSTETGPTSLDDVADNHFCVVVAGERSVRRRIHPLGAGGTDRWGWAASWHRPVFATVPAMVPGLRVESVTVVKGTWELRVHRVVGAPFGAKVEQTGWATAEPSGLHPVHGWEQQDEVPIQRGTAFTPCARVPRLSASVHGTALFASVAALTEVRVPVTVISANADTIEVGWEDDTTTRITFCPVSVWEQ